MDKDNIGELENLEYHEPLNKYKTIQKIKEDDFDIINSQQMVKVDKQIANLKETNAESENQFEL